MNLVVEQEVDRAGLEYLAEQARGLKRYERSDNTQRGYGTRWRSCRTVWKVVAMSETKHVAEWVERVGLPKEDLDDSLRRFIERLPPVEAKDLMVEALRLRYEARKLLYRGKYREFLWVMRHHEHVVECVSVLEEARRNELDGVVIGGTEQP